MKVYQKLPYDFEVHVAGYEGVDFSKVPKPFFVNHVISEDYITNIVTAEIKSFSKAMTLFQKVRHWCEGQKGFQQRGCRITVEELLSMIGFNQLARQHSSIEERVWNIEERPDSSFITFADVHADGKWDNSLADELTAKRRYLSLDYIARNGKEFKVLTLHFKDPKLAMVEAKYLEEVLQQGGFQGKLSVETSLAVAVIGSPIARPVIFG